MAPCVVIKKQITATNPPVSRGQHFYWFWQCYAISFAAPYFLSIPQPFHEIRQQWDSNNVRHGADPLQTSIESTKGRLQIPSWMLHVILTSWRSRAVIEPNLLASQSVSFPFGIFIASSQSSWTFSLLQSSNLFLVLLLPPFSSSFSTSSTISTSSVCCSSSEILFPMIPAGGFNPMM